MKTISAALLGAPLDPFSSQTRQHIALVAFLAWIGLGADGLSSSWRETGRWLTSDSRASAARSAAIREGVQARGQVPAQTRCEANIGTGLRRRDAFDRPRASTYIPLGISRGFPRDLAPIFDRNFGRFSPPGERAHALRRVESARGACCLRREWSLLVG